MFLLLRRRDYFLRFEISFSFAFCAISGLESAVPRANTFSVRRQRGSRLWESSPRPSRFGFRRNDSAVLFFLAFLHSFLRTHFCLERSSLGKVCGLEFAAALLCSDAHVVRVLLFIHHALMLTVVYLKNIRALFFIEKKNFSALPSNAANAALGGRGV